MNKNTIPYFTIFGKDFLAYTYDLTDSQIGKIVKQLCRGSIGLSMNSPKGCEEIFEKLKNSLLEDKEKYFKKIQQKQSASNARWNAPELQPQSECNPNPNPNPNPNQLDNKKTKEKKEISFENEFEEFWALYPRKLERKKSKTRFENILKNKEATFDEIMAGLKNYVEYLEQENTEKCYIKHSLTWLNGACWQNEYEIKEENEFLRGL